MVDVLVDGYPIIAFNWTLFAIATLFVFSRLFVQLRLRVRPWRELFVVAAWLLYLTDSVAISLKNDWNWFNTNVPAKDEDPALVPVLKAAFVDYVVYKQILYACKAALMCLYMDLTPKSFRKLWWAIWVSWAWIITGSLFHILFIFLDCRPLSANFVFYSYKGCANDPEAEITLVTTSWVIHLVSDLFVFILPFFILRALPSITPRQKRTASIMFGLGFINVAMAISHVVNYNLQAYMYGFTSTSVTLYSFEFILEFQTGSAVIIICIPYMRRLWVGTRSAGAAPGVTKSRIARMFSAIGKVESEDKDLEAVASDGPRTARYADKGVNATSVEEADDKKIPDL